MKRIFFTFILLLFLYAQAFSQNVSDLKQQQSAEHFISLVIQQDYEACWEMYDNSLRDFTKERFLKGISETYEMIPEKTDEFELFEKGEDLIYGKRYILYKYIYKKDKNKKKPEFVLELIFADDETLLVAGMRLISLQ